VDSGEVEILPSAVSGGEEAATPLKLTGTLLAVISAFGYTGANLCLRWLAKENIDPYLVSFVKAIPTFVVAIGLIAARRWRGLPVRVPRWVLWSLVAVGTTAQLFGNVGFQFALGVIGIALAVPITHGMMMVFGAIVGRAWLGEPITYRAAVATLVLIGAIVVLSSGANASHQEIASGDDASALVTIAGVLFTCAAGAAYALLGVTIRRAGSRRAPLSTSLLIVSGVGLVALAPGSLVSAGIDGIAAVRSVGWIMMLLAGVFNAVAFFALSRAFHLSTIVHVNLVNASQVAMAAIAGVWLFAEPWTSTMAIGVALTVVGLGIIRERRPFSLPSGRG
jgi:drug/metabolite transporter (DMT)-like permease